MPHLTLELDDADYAKLRELSLATRKPLRFYAADLVSRTINNAERLHAVEREMSFERARQSAPRPLEVDALIGQVHELVGDVAPIDFDATTWVLNWLKRPLPALGGRRPDEYLKSEVGRELLTILIGGITPVAFWTEPATFDLARAS